MLWLQSSTSLVISPEKCMCIAFAGLVVYSCDPPKRAKRIFCWSDKTCRPRYLGNKGKKVRQQFTVRCPSGWRSTPGKCVSVYSVSRVRIPLSPPRIIAPVTIEFLGLFCACFVANFCSNNICWLFWLSQLGRCLRCFRAGGLFRRGRGRLLRPSDRYRGL